MKIINVSAPIIILSMIGDFLTTFLSANREKVYESNPITSFLISKNACVWILINLIGVFTILFCLYKAREISVHKKLGFENVIDILMVLFAFIGFWIFIHNTIVLLLS